jgi:catechol 2,3-dioxygenase-like lactoylglutathione lyase family enzyme
LPFPALLLPKQQHFTEALPWQGAKLDHCVIHVSDWERSTAFYAEVLGAELVPGRPGLALPVRRAQLNVHGPGLSPEPVARSRSRPAAATLCFTWPGSIGDAAAHLARQGVAVELGPVPRHGACGQGTSVYFRDPDGSLLEFIAYDDAVEDARARP